jgi:hypothetical protein
MEFPARRKPSQEIMNSASCLAMTSLAQPENIILKISPSGALIKIVFDHTGFPQGLGEHLASGWKAHYWAPLEKLLA